MKIKTNGITHLSDWLCYGYPSDSVIVLVKYQPICTDRRNETKTVLTLGFMRQYLKKLDDHLYSILTDGQIKAEVDS